MPPEIINCDQGSESWFAARAGIPTASEYSTILAKGRDGGASVTRRKYMLRLAGEIILGESEETYKNAAMERGNLMEDDARRKYAFMQDVEPTLVGFVRNGDTGCSPDSLIGDDGVLEIKSALPSILIDKILRDDFPPEHKAQCQGALWVCEREWVDICIYWPRMPLFVKRAYRDAAYIANLARAVASFNEELAETVEKIRRYTGDPSADLKADLSAAVARDATPGGSGIRDVSGRELSNLDAG